MDIIYLQMVKWKQDAFFFKLQLSTFSSTFSSIKIYVIQKTSPHSCLQVEAEKMKVYLTASGEKEGKEMKVKRKEMDVFDMEDGNIAEFCKEREN